MRDLYQCVGCGWLTIRIRLLTPTSDGLRCTHCISAEQTEASHAE